MVKKGSYRTAPKCRVLSGNIGGSEWSIGYSQLTSGTILELVGDTLTPAGTALALAIALALPLHNLTNRQPTTAVELVIKSGISGPVRFVGGLTVQDRKSGLVCLSR